MRNRRGLEGEWYGIGVGRDYIGDGNGIGRNMERNDGNRTNYARRL